MTAGPHLLAPNLMSLYEILVCKLLNLKVSTEVANLRTKLHLLDIPPPVLAHEDLVTEHSR